jgi:cytochrome c oxidase subunit 2
MAGCPSGPGAPDSFPAVLKRWPHLIPLAILSVLIGGGTILVMLLIDWIPLQASEQSERVDHLMWFVVWCCAGVFTLVTVSVVYSVLRFRAKAGDESDGPPTHGNTRLEVIWTLIPFLLLIAVATWAYLVLSDNEATAKGALKIDVTAQQFSWIFSNPEAGVSSGDLRIPVDRQVQLRMRSKDVIHDFYVPEFRVKEDIVPGITTPLIINPTRVGTYQVICAELCGVGHGLMRARVIVMPQNAYDAWAKGAKAQLAAQTQATQQGATAPSSGTTTTGGTPATTSTTGG